SHELPSILIVDDDPVTCDLLCEVFTREGFTARFAQNGESALSEIKNGRTDILVSDIRMKNRFDGLMLLDRVRREHPSLPVILMTAFGSIETAIKAVKEGAFEYVSKPFDIETMVATVQRALTVKPIERKQKEIGLEEETASGMAGRNPAMLEIYKMIARVSDARAAVLITGESGTGKELVARAIHNNGPWHDSPFVAVNCGALTETLLESELFGHVKGSFTGAIANKRGIFEQAGEGTVFLDEISETSPALQVKLLRVLQEREVVPVGGDSPVKVSARTIAASNSNLEKLCEAGSFRRDLLYRLNVINIHLPPLRERRDDIRLLVTHFLRKHSVEGQPPPLVDESALHCLVSYSWPGNVRELENVIERAITLNRSGQITRADLPAKICGCETVSITPRSAADDLAVLFAGLPSIDEMERRYLLFVLETTGGNRKRAAEILGINRRTLYRMAERFQIEL
ncbi:MAG: sigma-54-dependent Fis family transcriptional regulator, partial [Blastocatellia bacterium]|nr:sigma-54-dependent Fis family transcriptional regulator [Blastocatellia bacterium]